MPARTLLARPASAESEWMHLLRVNRMPGTKRPETSMQNFKAQAVVSNAPHTLNVIHSQVTA